MRTAICVAVAAAIGASTSAEAVVLNPNGTGQVLVYPYYTVNAGFGTLLSLVNTTAQGKALKVHVREGYDGRDVLIFNLYLSPFDVWVAQLFDPTPDGSGAGAIATNDNSCTVPAFLKTFGPAPGQGPSVATLRTDGYTGTFADGGPTAPTRTREGYVEIIEMGTVTNASHNTLNAITHGSSGVPSSCLQLVQAWDVGANGYWTIKSTADLDVPSGGLYGSESIINVGEGLMYAVPATAIDGFSNAIQHSLPGAPTPDLSDATHEADGNVAAFVPVGGDSVEARYPRGEDAVSALFMADNLYNEYVVDPGLDAGTDWIITFPTKRFYTDPLLAGSSISPFDVVFGDNPPPAGSCSVVGPQPYDREENWVANSIDFATPPPFAPEFALCYAVNAMTFGETPSVFSSNLLMAPPVQLETGASGSGHVRVDLAHDWLQNAVPMHVLVSANGVTFTGMPALGFSAIDYVNGNVTPGMLANYSGAYPHRSTVACTNTLTPQPACGAGGAP